MQGSEHYKLEIFISHNAEFPCGIFNESALHYRFSCPNYTEIRSESYHHLNGYDLRTVLYKVFVCWFVCCLTPNTGTVLLYDVGL